MNVMLVCPAGDVFIGSIDTTGHKKTKEYIAGELRTYIEAIGPSNVTQICLDNTSAMLGALDNLVGTYPHLYKQGCCAHIRDLLLEDWGKEEMFKALIIRAKRVYIYIRNHHTTMALYCHYSPRLSLKVPPETRFACNFLMIARMLEIKDALERMVIDPRWNEYVKTLFNRQMVTVLTPLHERLGPLSVMMDFGNSVKILDTWLNRSLRLCESSTNAHPRWPKHGWR
jgi:hypothetical protein